MRHEGFVFLTGNCLELDVEAGEQVGGEGQFGTDTGQGNAASGLNPYLVKGAGEVIRAGTADEVAHREAEHMGELARLTEPDDRIAHLLGMGEAHMHGFNAENQALDPIILGCCVERPDKLRDGLIRGQQAGKAAADIGFRR